MGLYYFIFFIRFWGLLRFLRCIDVNIQRLDHTLYKEPLAFDHLGMLPAINFLMHICNLQFTITPANHTRRFYPQSTRRNIRIHAHPHFTYKLVWVAVNLSPRQRVHEVLAPLKPRQHGALQMLYYYYYYYYYYGPEKRRASDRQMGKNIYCKRAMTSRDKQN